MWVDIKGGKGPSSSLFLSEVIPKPIPGLGEALVRVKYFGLNRMDLGQRAGNYPVPPQASKILGVEFSGVVEAVGAHDEGGEYKVGDEVFGIAYGGRYAKSNPAYPVRIYTDSPLTTRCICRIHCSFYKDVDTKAQRDRRRDCSWNP